jgi:RHS repeat-associated protein
VKLNYDPNANNSFTGFDRFGRVADQVWKEYSGTPTAIDEYTYTYDRAGNRTSKAVVFKADHSLDEAYTYDALNRLTATTRGGSAYQSWGLDGAGNWSSVTTGGTTENRTQDAANETATIGGSSANVAYDAAGNMIVTPQPDSPATHFHCIYDAWNRLVEVRAADNSTVVAQYKYDGQNRRIIKKAYSGGVLSETRHYYLSSQNQVLEERVGASTSAQRQNVWGLQYVDDLVLRDRDTDANGSLDEQLYALQDANWNVVALVNTSGSAVERYTYTAYGKCEIRLSNFSLDGDQISNYAWTSRYTGREFDTETGLYYYRARYYSADMATFVGRDPTGYDAGDMNLYRYCGSDPLAMIDPNGLLANPSSNPSCPGPYSDCDSCIDLIVTCDPEPKRDKNCKCMGDIQSWLLFAISASEAYAACGQATDASGRPRYTTGYAIDERAIEALRKQGYDPKRYAETNTTTGRRRLVQKPPPGPCSAILMAGFKVHEGVHHRQVRTGRPISAKEWADDEVAAYDAQAQYYFDKNIDLANKCRCPAEHLHGGIIVAVHGVR